MAALDTGRLDAAKDAYGRALVLDPDNADARRGLFKARVYDFPDGEFDGQAVRQRIDQIQAEDPDDPHAPLFLGDLYAPDQPQKAIEHYHKAISLRPVLAQAHFGLGVLYHKQGRLDEALKAFAEAVRLSDQNPDYLNNLAFAYAEKGDYPKSIETYERLLSADGEFLLAYFEIAQVYRLMGQIGNARGYQEKGVQLLDDGRTADLKKNQAPWYFDAGGEPISFHDPVEKRCYAYYSLSVTLYLQGHEQAAAGYAARARGLETGAEPYVRAVVDQELRRIGGKNPALAARIAGYRRTFGITDQMGGGLRHPHGPVVEPGGGGSGRRPGAPHRPASAGGQGHHRGQDRRAAPPQVGPGRQFAGGDGRRRAAVAGSVAVRAITVYNYSL